MRVSTSRRKLNVAIYLSSKNSSDFDVVIKGHRKTSQCRISNSTRVMLAMETYPIRVTFSATEPLQWDSFRSVYLYRCLGLVFAFCGHCSGAIRPLISLSLNAVSYGVCQSISIGWLYLRRCSFCLLSEVRLGYLSLSARELCNYSLRCKVFCSWPRSSLLLGTTPHHSYT